MIAALLVLAVAGTEALSWWLTGRLRLAATAAWLGGLVIGAGAGGALSGWGAAAVAAGAVVWLVLRWRTAADLAMGALVVLAAAALVVDHASSPAAVMLGGVGLAVLLARTSNEVCRDVIARAKVSVPRVTEQEPPGPAPEETPRLKGGRFIGPLERWLIVGLALVGAEAVIVGLMAAKGIGRFPEISGDRDRGGNAEEFLVGSLVSWALAGAAALMLAVLRG